MSEMGYTPVFTELLQTIVDIIGRRSSEHYAVVMINNAIKKISKHYTILQNVSIKSSQFTESPQLIMVPPEINMLSPRDFHDILHQFLYEITNSIGKTAGHFFLKELKETIGAPCDTTLVTLGIDLSYMHFQQITEKRAKPIPLSDPAMVLQNILQNLLEILSKETTLDLSFLTLTYFLSELSKDYTFVSKITIKDIRYTQTDEVVIVPSDINALDPSITGAMIQDLLSHVQKWLEKKEIYSLVQTFSHRLKEEDSLALEMMGVDFNAIQISNETIYKHVIRALLMVLGRASTPQYAIFALDAILKKLGEKYGFLNYIKIDSTRYSDGSDAITIMSSIDTLKPVDAGRGIQKLIEETVKTLGEQLGPQFVDEFKRNLGKVYLTRMEEMGVNLHIVQLRQDLASLKSSFV
ncbi:MAG: hypothetical protein V1726_00665 [Methanobacteriota archaeon]